MIKILKQAMILAWLLTICCCLGAVRWAHALKTRALKLVTQDQQRALTALAYYNDGVLRRGVISEKDSLSMQELEQQVMKCSTLKQQIKKTSLISIIRGGKNGQIGSH